MRTVIQMIETSGPGGAENMLVRLSAALQQQDIKVIVLMLKDGWLKSELEDKNVTVEVLPVHGTLDLAWVRRALKIVRHHGADILHAHEFTMNCFGALMARASGIPCVATVHGKSYYADRLRRRLAYRVAARWAYFVAVSGDIREFVVNRIGVPVNRVGLVTNGVDVDKYRTNIDTRAAIRHDLQVAEQTVLIGAVGNLYPVKGHTYLLQAMELLRQQFDDFAVFIAGRGQLQEDLKSECKERNLDGYLQLLGLRADVVSLLQAADIYVMPSLSEGLPLSLLEAMAAGKAIVATDVGGIGEVIVDGCSGLLAKPRSASDLANAIGRLIDDPDLRKNLGLAAREAVTASYGLSRMVEQYVDLYRRLIKASNG